MKEKKRKSTSGLSFTCAVLQKCNEWLKQQEEAATRVHAHAHAQPILLFLICPIFPRFLAGKEALFHAGLCVFCLKRLSLSVPV